MTIRFSIGGWSFAAVMLLASAAHGGDYYLKSGATDWSKASSYCTDAERSVDSEVLPGKDDTIYAPAGG